MSRQYPGRAQEKKVVRIAILTDYSRRNYMTMIFNTVICAFDRVESCSL